MDSAGHLRQDGPGAAARQGSASPAISSSLRHHGPCHQFRTLYGVRLHGGASKSDCFVFGGPDARSPDDFLAPQDGHLFVEVPGPGKPGADDSGSVSGGGHRTGSVESAEPQRPATGSRLFHDVCRDECILLGDAFGDDPAEILQHGRVYPSQLLSSAVSSGLFFKDFFSNLE